MVATKEATTIWRGISAQRQGFFQRSNRELMCTLLHKVRLAARQGGWCRVHRALGSPPLGLTGKVSAWYSGERARNG